MATYYFYVQSSADHASPGSSSSLSAAIWTPNVPGWNAPLGSLSPVGDGVWGYTPSAGEVAGGVPLLFYATGDASDDPIAEAWYPGHDAYPWQVGDTSIPIPFWMGTADSNGYQPAPGLAIDLAASLNGAAFAAATGTVSEAGVSGYDEGGYSEGGYGAGTARGFYLYHPSAADVVSAGTLLFEASAAGALTQAWQAPISTGSSGGGQQAPAITWPDPSPIVAGTPLGPVQLDATASVPGAFDYSPDAGIILPAGTYTLSAVFTPYDATSYSTAIGHASLTVTPTPTPTPAPPAAARDRDILNAIKSALDATNAFDATWLWGFEDAAEQGAEYTRAVAIVPGDEDERDTTDGPPAGIVLVDARCRLLIMARDEDKQRRDEDADRLLNVCRNALNGAALNAVLGSPVVYPQWTKVTRAVPRPPTPPQRTIEATFTYRYDAPDWAGFDTQS